jgi:hypothetical protein
MVRVGFMVVLLVAGWSLACAGGADSELPPVEPEPVDAEGDAEGEGDAEEGEGDAEEGEGDAEEGEGTPDGGTPDEAEPAPAPAPKTDALPSDLDPATSKPNAREEALLDKYKVQRDATPIIAKVLKTDPANDVRVIAVEVFKARWKQGIDTSGAQQNVIWCARNGNSTDLRAKCLDLLGEKGNAGAGAALYEGTQSDDKGVRTAAESACKTWMKRFPRGVEGAEGACKGSG